MSKVAKATFGLMLATMIAKFLGFGRELVLASSYGASIYSDAFLTAMNIPTVLFTIIGATLSTVLIPMYFEVFNNEGKEYTLKFINNIVNIVIIICILLMILGYIFTPELVKLFAMGFEGKTLAVTIQFTRVTIISIVFTGLSYIMSAYLQIKNNFIIPGLGSAPKNIIIMLSIILSVKYGPDLMIWGTLIGICMEFIFQLPFAIRNGYKYKFYINIKDKYIKKTILLIGPVLIGVSVNQVNTMVDRTLASTLAEGSISALNYANKLNTFVMALFIASVSAVIYPILSKLSSQQNKEKFINSVVKSINSVILLIIPISIGAIILANPIVKVLFERGEFDSRATSMTAMALIMYSLGMCAFGLIEILGKIFFSIQDTKTPMKNAAISMGINIILNILLVKYLKLAGLALATSISSTICMALLFKSLKNKIGYFGQDQIIKTTAKSFFASIIMGIVTYFSYYYLNTNLGNGQLIDLISLLISILLGAIVYGIIIVILKIEEVNYAKEQVLNRIKR